MDLVTTMPVALGSKDFLRSWNLWSNHNVHILLFLLQHEIDYGGTDAHVSPRVHQHPQIANPFTNSVVPPGTGLYGQSAAGFAPRPSITDQSKNTIFSNALSSPVRRSLQNYHITQGAGNGGRNAEANLAGANRETNSASSNDTSMDMVSDSAGNEFYQWFAARCFCNQTASHASVCSVFLAFLSLIFSPKLSPYVSNVAAHPVILVCLSYWYFVSWNVLGMLYSPQCVREFNIMNVNADCVVIYSYRGSWLNLLKLG